MKRTLLIAALSAASVIVQAQNKGGIAFGVKAGFNFSKFSGEDANEANTRTSLHGGVVINFPISKTFSVQPELLFSGEGAKHKVSDKNLNINFIILPVFLQYTHSSGFFAETGPQIGFLVSAKDELDNSDKKDNFKGTDFGWGIGAGYKVNTRLGFGARYILGFTSILKNENFTLRQNNLALSAFYVIR